MSKKTNISRGIRNNNPLNIIHGASWKGMATEQTDRRFVQFKTMEYGIRAAFKTLQTYHTRWRCLTLRQYITRWCPPAEKGNNTEKYIQFVAKSSNVKPDEWLPAPRKAGVMWCEIVDAMIKVECGQSVSKDTFIRAYSLAFNQK